MTSDYILIAQTFCLVMAVILVLRQNRGAALGGAFGGGSDVYLTRRGIEKWITNFTTIFIVLFVILRFVALFVS